MSMQFNSVQALKRNTLQLVTPAAETPVTLEEAKDHIRISWSTEDDYLTRLLTVATNMTEAYLHRALVDRTYTIWLDAVRHGSRGIASGLDTWTDRAMRAVYLDFAPVSSVSSVKSYDTSDTETTLSASTTYDVDLDDDNRRARVVLRNGESWSEGALREYRCLAITYVAGYGGQSDVPEDYKQAVLTMLAALYANRGDCGAAADPDSVLSIYQYAVVPVL